jgi:3'-phosphoadenosine 5'-phosphosulfate (PAPS) 3'-phosphatase
MKNSSHQLVESFTLLAEEAGRAAKSASREATLKADGSPVTPADMLSHQILTAGIKRILGPETNILSEEGGPPIRPLTKGLAVVIDPLDGTSNFHAGKKNWSVLFGVLKDGVPVLGIAVVPRHKLTVVGGTLLGGSEVRWHGEGGHPRAVRPLGGMHDIEAIPRLVVPRRFFQSANIAQQEFTLGTVAAFRAALGEVGMPLPEAKPSSEILSSILPVFKRRGNVPARVYQAREAAQRPGDWDLCAWDAILRGAGGMMTSLQGQPIQYGKAEADFKHSGFICWREASMAAQAAPALNAAFSPPKHPFPQP